ncbi:MAG: winged helix-turn-helix domain-containing protein [Methanotrichaceae archaeon]
MKRSKGEIIGNVLEVCLIGASKTRVVYGSDLNFRTVNPYLDSLMSGGFITATERTPTEYKTTDKGKELLAAIRDAYKFF